MSEQTSTFPQNNIRFRPFATTSQTHYLKSEGVICGSIFERVFLPFGMEEQLAFHFRIV
jgi:hypothetical protein